MSGHLDGPPPGPPDPPYIPGDLGAPSPEEFARRRASSEPRPANPTPEERVRDAPEVIMDANGNYWRRYEDGTLSMCPTSTDNMPLAEPVVTYHPDLGVWPDQSATHGVLLDEIRELEARAIAAEDAAAAATAAERERTEEAYRLAAEYREKAREATALLRPKCLSCRGTGLQADGRYQELKCEACGGTGRTGEYDAAVQAIAAAERGRTGELEAALHAARAFVNWHAEGPCGCDGEPDDQCDSCRALAVLDLIEKGDTEFVSAAEPGRVSFREADGQAERWAAAATPDQPTDAYRPWPIAPDTVMPPRRQPIRWGSRADDPPTEIHDDPQRTKAYLAGLAAGRTEAAAAATAAERERTRRALAEPRAYRLALAEYAARRERGEDRFESMRLAIGLLAADLIEKGDTDA